MGGIAKSAGNTLAGVYDLMQYIASSGAGGLLGNRNSDARGALSQELTPNEAEQPFYTAGNIAQFLAPTPAGKLGLVGQAAQSGLLTHLQGGTAGESATAAATAGLVPPVVGRAAGALRGAAVTQYERALGATAGPMKEAAARVAPEAIERGLTGGLGTLAARGAKESDDAGTVIRQTYDAATQRGVTVSTVPARAKLDALRQKYVTPGKAGDVVTNPTAVGRIDTLTKMLDDIGPSATPTQLWQVRKNLDEIIGPNGFGQSLSKGTAKKIEKAARAGLQGELDKADPAIKELNKTYGFWEELEKVTTSTQRRRTSQEGPLAAMLAGGAGAGFEFARGGDPLDALMTGAASGAIVRGYKSPRFRTTGAVGMDRLAGGLEAGSSPIAQLLAALFGGAAGTPEPNPPLGR